MRREFIRHAGTTDIDVQINLEIVCGAANATVLEKALRGAGFTPEAGRPWRWVGDGAPDQAGIKFEMLADLDNEPASSTILFDAWDEKIEKVDDAVHRSPSRTGAA